MLLVAHARRSGSRLEGVLFSCYGHVVIDSYLQEFFKLERSPPEVQACYTLNIHHLDDLDSFISGEMFYITVKLHVCTHVGLT
jgi:hypothetical protein